MKKIVCNVVFALGLLAVLAPNVLATPTDHGPAPTPDAASTSAMLGIAALGFAAVRKYLR